MKRILASILIVFVIFFSFPFSALATDYGDYCSDEITTYDTNGLPSWSSLLYSDSRNCGLIYNTLDSCYYLCISKNYYGSQTYNAPADFIADNYNLYYHCTVSQPFTYWIYKYDPANSNTWVVQSSAPNYTWTQSNLICSVSAAHKFKFLWINKDTNFNTGTYTYNVTNLSSNLTSNDIFANFFDPSTGEYLNNDPAVESGSGGESGGGSVDLTPTNTILTSINNTLEDVADDVADIKTSLSSLSVLSTINSNIADIKSALTNNSTGIGAKLDTINSTLGTINTSIGSLNTSIGGMNTGLGGKLDTLITNVSNIASDTSDIFSSLTENSVNSVDSFKKILFSKLDTMNTELRRFSLNFSTSPSNTHDDFSGMWIEYMEDIFNLDDEFNLFTNLHTVFDVKFTDLYNIILYGNAEGEDAFQEQNQSLSQFKTNWATMNTHITDSKNFINNSAAGVSAYITTFTNFYNGTMALSVGLSVIAGFGLAVILIRKAIGR